MTEASASSRQTPRSSSAVAVLLILTIPVGLYAVEWALEIGGGAIHLSGGSGIALATALVYCALGLNAIYRVWKNQPGSIPLIWMMWAIAAAACLMSHFWHLNSRLTPFKLLEALALFSTGFLICVVRLTQLRERLQESSDAV